MLIATIARAYMMPQVLISFSYLYAVDIGTYAILIGYSFIISTGLLSLRRIKLTPIDIAVISRAMTSKTYIAKRLLTSIAILIGVSMIIFWLYYISPSALLALMP